MTPRIVFFTQPGCLSCELMKCFLEAKEIVFEERNIGADAEARRQMTEQYGSRETPTLVIFSASVSNDVQDGFPNGVQRVIVGFDPVLLDQLLDAAPSSDSVAES
jgi:glutaredoxin